MNKEFKEKLRAFYLREDEIRAIKKRLNSLQNRHDYINLKDFGLCNGQTITIKSVMELMLKFVEK